MQVLITGGTGLVGQRLTKYLMEKGYTVAHLSRRPEQQGKVKTYLWDIEKQYIEEEAILHSDYIVHLAGASVFDKSWTKEYKQEILDSRIKTANLLFGKLKIIPQTVKAFISASAIGIYGDDTGDMVVNEESPAGKDFLADVVKKWEGTTDNITQLKIRTAKLRFGIVLASEGGALEKMVASIKKGVGAPLGSGNQFISWVHIDDVCQIIGKAIEDNSVAGVYNVVSPNPVTNKDFINTIAKILDKPILLPSVPAFALKLALGSERAKVLLGGNKVDPNKIIKSGYQFKFPNLQSALDDLLKE